MPYNGGIVANNPSQIEGIETLTDFWKTNNLCQTELPELQLVDLDTTDNSTVTLFQFTYCDCDANVRLYRINNGRHTWYGV